MRSWITALRDESGFNVVYHSSKDTKLLCLQRFVRLFAYGATYLILVQFLSLLDISDGRIGLFMSLTLLGDVVISFILTLITDQVGRRKILALGSGLMIMSGVVFCLVRDYWILVLASIIGVISPSGNEIGPFRAVEESVLSQLTEKEERSDIFAWYTMCGTAGAALGTVTTGFMIQLLQSSTSWSMLAVYRTVFAVYACIGVLKLALTLLLSQATELQSADTQYQLLGGDTSENVDSHELRRASADANGGIANSDTQNSFSSGRRPDERIRSTWNDIISRAMSLLPRISHQSISILSRLLLLFAIDSFASGMASPSWLTYFFTTYHKLKPSYLGSLFFVTNILATVSNLAALPIARRLGPLKTMVLTHLPSAIFLGLVALPPQGHIGTWIAMAFLSLRACTQSMDQAPRQAFLAAAVLPAERTAVLGVVNIAKTLAQAGGIGVSGTLAQIRLWLGMFGTAGILKASYDLLMLWMFLGLKDREGGRL